MIIIWGPCPYGLGTPVHDVCLEAKQSDCTLRELKALGIKAAHLKGVYSTSELRKAFSLEELIRADFSATELREGNFSIHELKNAFFTAQQLKGVYRKPSRGWPKAGPTRMTNLTLEVKVEDK
jgi:hypothetical protein